MAVSSSAFILKGPLPAVGEEKRFVGEKADGVPMGGMEGEGGEEMEPRMRGVGEEVKVCAAGGLKEGATTVIVGESEGLEEGVVVLESQWRLAVASTDDVASIWVTVD